MPASADSSLQRFRWTELPVPCWPVLATLRLATEIHKRRLQRTDNYAVAFFVAWTRQSSHTLAGWRIHASLDRLQNIRGVI